MITLVQFLTLSASLLSIVIATISLIRTRKVAAEQLELRRITARLNEKQIERIDADAKQRALPKLTVALTKLGKSRKFIIANRGEASAFDLNFSIVDCSDNPTSSSEIADKFPYTELRPGQQVKLIAAIHMQSPRKYHVVLAYNDSSGETHSENHHVSL